MKKFNLSLALLSLAASFAYAGGIDNTNSVNNVDNSIAFSVGAEVLNVEAVDNDFVFGAVKHEKDKYSMAHSVSVKPKYHLGYHVDLGYVVPENGASLVLGTSYLNTKDSKSKDGESFIPAYSDKASKDIKSSAKSNYKYTDVDLLIGKEFVLQDRYHFHPFAGARYAKIDAKDTVTLFNKADTKKPVRADKFNNAVHGIGPRVGVDAAVDLSGGFSLTARAAGSLLLSDAKAKYLATTFADKGNTTQETRDNSNDTTIPGVDYRLGVSYSYEFSPETNVSAELGFTAVHYFDALKASKDGFGKADLAYQGPYLRVQVDLA